MCTIFAAHIFEMIATCSLARSLARSLATFIWLYWAYKWTDFEVSAGAHCAWCTCVGVFMFSSWSTSSNGSLIFVTVGNRSYLQRTDILRMSQVYTGREIKEAHIIKTEIESNLFLGAKRKKISTVINGVRKRNGKGKTKKPHTHIGINFPFIQRINLSWWAI